MKILALGRKLLIPITGVLVAALLVAVVIVFGPKKAEAASASHGPTPISLISVQESAPFNVAQLSYNVEAAGRGFHRVQANPCVPPATGAVPRYLTFVYANPQDATFATTGYAAYGYHDSAGTAHFVDWSDTARLPDGSSLFWGIPYGNEIGLVLMNHQGATAYYDRFPNGLNFSETQSPWIVQICYR